MKLSVLVPIYNVEPYLRECLESIHKQTVTDMEVLCLNDGSTDHCGDIIAEYVNRDCRFRLVDKENTGYGHTLNVGLQEAQGEYIGIVESDDFIDPDMMQDLLAIIEETNADVVKSNYRYCSADEVINNTESDNLNGLSTGKLICPGREKGVFLMAQSLWSALYRKSFLDNNRIRFRETPGASYQDVSFAFMVMANANSIYLVDKSYYHYRVSNPNASVKMDYKLDKLCAELDFIETYIEKRNDKQDLKLVFSRLSFRVLMDTYLLAAPEYQFVILYELERRLRVFADRGDLETEIWDEGSRKTAFEILCDKNAFYKKTGKAVFDGRLWQGTMNARIYREAFFSEASSYDRIVLYGAGKVGKEVKEELLTRGVPKSAISFAVTSTDDNEQEIDGIPVRPIEHFRNTGDDTVFIIAVKESSQYELLCKLQSLNIKNILFLTDSLRKLPAERI